MLNIYKLKETVDKLVEEVKKILENAEIDKPVVFSTSTGGIPSYGDLDLTILDREERFQYSTSENGDAYYGAITILCKRTGLKDNNGNDIFIDKSGEIFVEEFIEGDASSFDICNLLPCHFKNIKGF